MPVSMNELGISNLSAEDKLALAEELIDSIGGGNSDFDIPEKHWEIIGNRLREIEAQPVVSIRWDELRNKLLGKDQTP